MAKKKFEDNMNRIIEIAEVLEDGGTSLEDSIKLYKEAVKTVKILKSELDTASGSVVIMKKELDGTFIEEAEVIDEF